MGGFAGGDEAGYWDEETLGVSKNFSSGCSKKVPIEQHGADYCIKAYSKNVIVQDNTIRWIRSNELYDTVCFVSHPCSAFTIEGYADIENHPVYKAYLALCNASNDPELEDFFYTHKVVIIKCIPSQADMGGDSSNVAAFIHLAKEICNLILSIDELAKIAHSIFPDAPFFLYNYLAADVSQSGEIIEVDF